jgi:hypothetical protein
MRKLLLLCILCFLSINLWAADFGVLLDATPGVSGNSSGVSSGANGNFDFTMLLIPRLSVPVGAAGEVFVSAAVKADYENETWSAAPELLRTEFSTRAGDLEFALGRVQYTDPLGFIADGLLDGARLSYDTVQAGTFSLGAFYTGLLSKKRINITMTGEELASFNSEVDYSDFAGTYFAPRRFIASLGWQHPGLGEFVRAKAAFISQSDLGDSRLHSQYLALNFAAPVNLFVFGLGGALEFIEDDGDLGLGLAGEFGISCNLPGAVEDVLSLRGRFSSGTTEDGDVAAFLPITTIYQGQALKAKLSGISTLTLDYLARVNRSFSASLISTYFIRGDLATYANYGDDGYFLGNEFFGRLVWSPVSDIQLNLGGGIFLPSMGNAAPNADPVWRVELNIIFALY